MPSVQGIFTSYELCHAYGGSSVIYSKGVNANGSEVFDVGLVHFVNTWINARKK